MLSDINAFVEMNTKDLNPTNVTYRRTPVKVSLISRNNNTHFNHIFIIYVGPFNCLWCTRTFVNSANCRKHKLKDHPLEVAEYEGEL